MSNSAEDFRFLSVDCKFRAASKRLSALTGQRNLIFKHKEEVKKDFGLFIWLGFSGRCSTFQLDSECLILH